jgi:hypothetical protein
MQMVPPVMMTRTRDSGYCVAMVLARLGMSDIVTVPLAAGRSSSNNQPFRSVPCPACKCKRQNR